MTAKTPKYLLTLALCRRASLRAFCIWGDPDARTRRRLALGAASARAAPGSSQRLGGGWTGRI